MAGIHTITLYELQAEKFLWIAAMVWTDTRAMSTDRLVPDREAVAERLQLLRLALNYTNQRRWAEFLDIDPQLWSNWERARALPTMVNARHIQIKTGATTEWIFWEERAGMPHGLIEKIDQKSRERRALAR